MEPPPDAPIDIGELKETISKYKRVTARLREVLEDTKKEAAEKTARIAALQAATSDTADAALWALLQRVEGTGAAACRVCGVAARLEVSPTAGVWCFVDVNHGEGKWSGWVKERSLVEHVPDVALPALLPSLTEASELRLAVQETQASLAASQDDYRRFRIRSETIVRQKDDEIDRLTQACARVGGEGSFSAADPRLEDSQRRIDQLLRARAELQERESSLREEVAQLQHDLEEVRAAARPEPEGTPRRATSPVTPTRSPSTDSSELHRVLTEYSEYRRRAMELIKEKEETATKLSAQLRAAKASAPTLIPKPASAVSVSEIGDSASVKADLFASEATREYLKNILLRYMSTSEQLVKHQLEAAIAAVMEFTPAEITTVKAAREKAAPKGLWGLLAK